MTYAKPHATEHGFTFGAMTVEATAAMEDGRVCITVKTEAGQQIEVYASPTGRSLRAFKRGRGEMKA